MWQHIQDMGTWMSIWRKYSISIKYNISDKFANKITTSNISFTQVMFDIPKFPGWHNIIIL